MKRPFLGVLVVLLSLWSASALAGVDILEQDVALDLRSDTLKATLTLKIKALSSSTKMTIVAPSVPVLAASLNSEPATISPQSAQPGAALTIGWATPLPANGEAELTLKLEGTVSCGVCRWDSQLKYLLPTWAGVYWYALSLERRDAFVGQITLIAPAGFAVAAGEGKAVASTTNTDGSITHVFNYTHETDQLFFYAGAVAQVDSSLDVPTVGLYPDGTGRQEIMQQAVDVASQLAGIYGDFAQIAPVDQVRVLIVPNTTAFGGFGMLGTVFLTEAFFDDRLDQLDQGVAHELAHTWWGNLASAPLESPELRFLHESFAEYTTWRGLEQLEGEQRRTAGSRMNAVWYMFRRPGDQDIALLDPALASSPVWIYVAYHKGSVVLRTLEDAAGSQTFAAALRRLLQSGYRGLSAKGLVEALQAEGFDAAPLAQQWLYQTGFPQLTVHTTITPQGDGATVAVRADGDERYPLLDLPLTLWSATGEKTELRLTAGGAGLSEHCAYEPLLIQVDPRWTTVREINPVLAGDVSLDGRVDAVDLVEVALRVGGALPSKRRVDGSYDPLYDLDRNEKIDLHDLQEVIAAAAQR